MRPEYPREIGTVLDALYGAGYSAYIVGGALRDALLGRAAHDWDVTTSAMPEETEAVFCDFRVIKTGIQHGTVTVLSGAVPVEITTFRIDGEYRDARHPEAVTFTRSIEEDLARRDFTVNAMAYSPREGLVDLFGGQEDLSRRIIRAVGQPEKRFSEDALRILRAFRFMSKLDFDIDPATLSATGKMKNGLAMVSAERITVELCGLLEGRAPRRALSAMIEQHIFDAIAPDLCPSAEILGAVERLPAVFELRLAAFLKGCRDHGQSLVSCLRLSNKSAARLRVLQNLCDLSWQGADEPRVRRLMAQAEPYGEDLRALMESDFFGLGEEECARILSLMTQIRRRGDCLSPKNLAIGGRALLEAGFAGPEVGKILAALYEAVLDDPAKNTPEILTNMAEQMRS